MNRIMIRAAAVGVVAAAGLALAGPSLAQGSLPTLTLTVSKNSVKVGGETVSGAVNIAMTLSGEQTDEPALILLKPGVTAAQFGAVTKKFGRETPLDAIDPYGTIVYDSSVTGEAKTTTGTAVLPAGNYVAVNNGSALTPFTVTASANPASLPTPKASVRAIDFGYRGASTLHDGELVEFKNEGFLIHMFEAAQVKNATDAKLAEAALLAGNVKRAKSYVVAAPISLAGPLSSGEAQESAIDAPPGIYVLFCEMNTQDGREHFQLGMYRTIKVMK